MKALRLSQLILKRQMSTLIWRKINKNSTKQHKHNKTTSFSTAKPKQDFAGKASPEVPGGWWGCLASVPRRFFSTPPTRERVSPEVPGGCPNGCSPEVPGGFPAVPGGPRRLASKMSALVVFFIARMCPEENHRKVAKQYEIIIICQKVSVQSCFS